MKDIKVKENEEIHDRIYSLYEGRHGEIFNDIEQNRLSVEIKELETYINTQNEELIALDLGCGSGNITNHLLKNGYHVIASDVSEKFLGLVKEKFGREKLSTFKLNGVDLDGLEDGSVDLIIIYSVIHHIPDYMKILDECLRVLKKGGIVYIDHEHNENFWRDDPIYLEYKRDRKKDITAREKKHKYINPLNYYKFIKRKIILLINPRYQPEGDIHVFKDDHIEWCKIKELFSRKALKILKEQDYLHYQKGVKHDTFIKYKNKTSDMKLLAARK